MDQSNFYCVDRCSDRRVYDTEFARHDLIQKEESKKVNRGSSFYIFIIRKKRMSMIYSTRDGNIVFFIAFDGYKWLKKVASGTKFDPDAEENNNKNIADIINAWANWQSTDSNPAIEKLEDEIAKLLVNADWKK